VQDHFSLPADLPDQIQVFSAHFFIQPIGIGATTNSGLVVFVWTSKLTANHNRLTKDSGFKVQKTSNRNFRAHVRVSGRSKLPGARAQSLPQSWWPARRSPDPSVPPSSPIGRPRGERARTCPATHARYPGRGLPAVARDGLGSELGTPVRAVAGPTKGLSRLCWFGLVRFVELEWESHWTWRNL
jgi:hypothetical protein